MVGGTGVHGKISIKICGEASFKAVDRIKVPNDIFIDEICDGDFETPCSIPVFPVSQVTSFL
jgi:hypothetical protein